MAKHKCKIPDPPADTGRWLGTYGDMVTLLMAFFVMLFAVQETNEQKFNAFVSGLAGPFDNPAVQLGLVSGHSVEAANTSPIALIAPNPGQVDAAVRGPGSVESDAQSQLDQVAEELEDVLEATSVPIQVDLRDDERGLVVSISTDEILFPVGSAEMAPEGRQLIGEIAPVLVGAPNTVVIEGHTDDTPLDRAGYSNWNLSTDRAVAVLELLGEVHGLPYDRISATGFGEHRPLVTNDTDANRSINRRVEILVVGLDVSREGAPPPPGNPPGGAPAGQGAPPAPPAEDQVVAAPAQPAVDPGVVPDLRPGAPAQAQAPPADGDQDVAEGTTSGAGAGGRPETGNTATLATILGQ